jgi:hypothetical protein
MEKALIVLAVAVLGYLAYTIARSSRSDKGHGSSGPRPGEREDEYPPAQHKARSTVSLDLSKFRVPAGSLVVDSALVVALIWGGATMTEQLGQISRRVAEIEQGAVRSNSDARLMVLERRADEMSEWKGEMREQLNRIEDKLDRLASRP